MTAARPRPAAFAATLLAASLSLASAAGCSGQGGTVSCTTNACIARGIAGSLTGVIAKDESVMTHVSCKAASVKRNPDGSWTADCTVDYSDGSVWDGFGNYVPAKDRVTFQPQRQLR